MASSVKYRALVDITIDDETFESGKVITKKLSGGSEQFLKDAGLIEEVLNASSDEKLKASPSDEKPKDASKK